MSDVTVVKINTKPEPDPYTNPTQASQCALVLDPVERRVWVQQEYRTNSTTMHRWHGREWFHALPGHPDPDEVRSLLEAQADGLAAMCDGYSEEWDGSNYRGAWNDEAQTAANALERELDALAPDHWEFWDTGDWLQEDRRDMLALEEGQVKEWAEDAESLAIQERVVLSEDVEEWAMRERQYAEDTA